MSAESQGNGPGLTVIVMKDVLCRVQEQFPGSSLTFVDQGRIERAIWTLNSMDRDGPDPRRVLDVVLLESFWIPERLDWLEVDGSIRITRITFIRDKSTWSQPR